MDEIIETDILVVGVGFAGCMAAIEAFENSVNVVLARAPINEIFTSRVKGNIYLDSLIKEQTRA